MVYKSDQIYKISGGRPINGSIMVSGAKNSVLKLMAASILTDEPCVIRNVPRIADVLTMKDILESLGVVVELKRDDASKSGTMHINSSAMKSARAPFELVRSLRASINLLGPMLARFGRAEVAVPGGCVLGERKTDIHVVALSRLGADFEKTTGEWFNAKARRLKGTDIALDFPSVGATENALLASVTAEGETRISNIAREPEIVDLVCFLRAMGADIEWDQYGDMNIRGVESLRGAEFEVMGDRIEAGTYAIAAALCKGDVQIEGINPGCLEFPLDVLREIGIEVNIFENSFAVRSNGDHKGIEISTFPYPGFPTDLMPPLLVLLSSAVTPSLVTENIFDDRFRVIPELRKMGVSIDIDIASATIRGKDRLKGANVTATDLRAGVALVLAALAAEGESKVYDIYHIDRGYEDLVDKIASLGGSIVRESFSMASSS